MTRTTVARTSLRWVQATNKFFSTSCRKAKIVYRSNCLEWHLGDETVKQTPQGSVWSCRIASESFDCFNRFAVALAKSQDHRASCGVFAFGSDWFQVTIGL